MTGHSLLVNTRYRITLAGLQDVFQVYQPVPFAPTGNNDCEVETLLMDHVFAYSYGAPFIGKSSI